MPKVWVTFGNADQIVGDQVEQEVGSDTGNAAVLGLAHCGGRMSLYEAARQYDQKALQVIASVPMDEKQPTSLRLAAAIRCLNCSRSAGGLIQVG